MSFGATKLLAASGGEDAYSIDQSIMLDNVDDAHLERTPSSAGNQRTWTQSCWIKITGAGDGYIGFYGFPGGSAVSYYTGLFYYTGGNIVLLDNYAAGAYSGGPYVTFNTGLVDRSAWYHLLLIFDTTQSTDTNRIQVWVNGVRCTNISATTWPALNYQGSCNSTALHTINQVQDTYYGSVMFAEYHHIDGTVKAYTDFTETDSVTGQLIPKEYEGGSYGTNGFYLKFASGAIGTDSSGEGNNLTASNLANADVLLDTPTNNFPTLNSLEPYNTTVSTLAQGNLNIKAATYSSGNYGSHFVTFILPRSGKWYFEWLSGIQAGIGNQAQIGVSKQGPTGLVIPNQSQNPATFGSSTAMTMEISGDQAEIYDGGSSIDTDTGLTATSYVCAIAIDIDNDKFWGGYDNGSSITWMNSGNPATGANGAAHTFDSDSGIYATTTVNGGNSNRSYIIVNFGQNGTFCGYKTAGGNADGAGIGNFFYSPPSGFKALCQKNLPTPTIKKSTEFFDNLLYTGDASAKTVSGLSFRPDYLWIKNRTDGYHHANVDSTRGATQIISSSQNIVELTSTEQVKTITSDGFTLGNNSDGNNYVNLSADNYVAWCWRAGGASPSKTYAVKVVSDSGNKYRFDDYGTSAVTLNLQEGGTYTFDQSDSSNATHPLRFSTTSDGSHGGGSEYTTGVTTNGTPGSSGAYTTITVAASAPTLYYYCTAHSGMGGQVNTNSTFGATNLDGSSLSIVSENTTSGLSIVRYVGTGSNATVGHELGVAPSVIILKNRDTNDNWRVYSRNDPTDYLGLNSTIASTDDNTSWNDTAPTSSVFTIGTDTNTNRSGDEFVAYCFAEIEGFSKFGSYYGNGSANGPYIYTSFRPAWIMTKIASTTVSGGGDWTMRDVKRDIDNPSTQALYANLYNAESTTSLHYDILSNGFKTKSTGNDINQNAQTFFYMAFAEFPFKYANAR